MTFGERLKALRKGQKGEKMTQTQLGERVNLSKANISKYEAGDLEPNLHTLCKFSEIFDVPTDYLLCLSDNPIQNQTGIELPENLRPITTQTFQILGNIACGAPLLAQEDAETCTIVVEEGAEIHADFCLRATGDSMIGARIYDGDMVFIRKQEMVEDGEIAAVLIEDEATLKRVKYDEFHKELSLFPENPLYPTMRFSGEQLSTIRILGKAVSFRSTLH